MCAGCMEIVTLIHDPSYTTNATLAKALKDTMREVIKANITDEEMAPFFVILGAELMDWKEASNG